MAIDRPLLVLPAPAKAPPPSAPPKIGSGAPNPNKWKQLDRLGPQFEALRLALEQRRAALRDSASGAALEQVLVFETNGTVQAFMECFCGRGSLPPKTLGGSGSLLVRP